MNRTFLNLAIFLSSLILCLSAQAETLNPPGASTRSVTPTPSFTATYRSGNINTLTITGKNFMLFSLLNLNTLSSGDFSYSGYSFISVYSFDGNTTLELLPSLLTSDGNSNFFYTVAVSKKGISKAVCKSSSGSSPSFSFTATSENPPKTGTFSLTFVVANPGALPLTKTKVPVPTLQGLPNLVLQIGSAQFSTSKITKNKAVYP